MLYISITGHNIDEKSDNTFCAAPKMAVIHLERVALNTDKTSIRKLPTTKILRTRLSSRGMSEERKR